MDDHEPYDPDGDVSRYLNFEDSKPLTDQETTRTLVRLNNGFSDGNHYELVDDHGFSAISLMPSTQNNNGAFTIMPLNQNNNGSVRKNEVSHVRNGSFERFLIEVIERVRVVEGYSSSSSASRENLLQAVFQGVAPENLNCSNCTALREVFHSSQTRNLNFAVHGDQFGRFSHAIFEYHEQLGATGNSSNRELFLVNLTTRSNQWIQSLMDVSISIMERDATGFFYDSLAMFRDALSADYNPPMQPPQPNPGFYSGSSSGNPNFEVGESSGTKNDQPENVQSTFFSPDLSGYSTHDHVQAPGPVDSLPPANTSNWTPPVLNSDWMSPVNGMNWMPPVNFSQINDVSSPIDISDDDSSDSENYLGPPLPPSPVHDPLPDGRTPLAIQRQRTARMRLPELTNYIHLSINEAAKELRMCSTALKNICRRNGMERWPSRQIRAIDRHIERLRREMLRDKRRGSLFKYLEEIQKLQLKKYKIYQSVLKSMNKEE